MNSDQEAKALTPKEAKEPLSQSPLLAGVQCGDCKHFRRTKRNDGKRAKGGRCGHSMFHMFVRETSSCHFFSANAP